MIKLPENGGVVVCYGMGVDSTAMLIALRDAGIRPDAITFADTGAEKPETYDYLKVINPWLVKNDFPMVTVVKKNTLDSTPYNDLGGNCSENATLPSLAFGMKSCSIKWKADPQDYFLKGCKSGPNARDPHPLYLGAKAAGKKLVKLIGYDSSPADIKRAKKAEAKRSDADEFLFAYPLIDLGWKREDCVARILEEGLPVPVKSACFFCPASQKWELFWLAGKHTDLFLKALDIEHGAMMGPHSRWDADDCDYGDEWAVLVASPGKKWPKAKGTVGLGRSFSWNRWARENGLVDWKSGEFIADPAWCLAKAEELKGSGGNAEDARICAGF